MDRFCLCEVNYPKPETEEQLLAKTAGQLPESIRKKMVEYAGEVRRLFMGEKENISGGIEITFSTRTLLRWADLTIRYQPLSRQGIQPVAHALDRALGFRACKATRAMLHELVQRVFPRNIPHETPLP
jgi:cobaltochelatase CobS